ncbi:MAG: RagB/SusD family nutrient uptake outer membrane protein [Bacteroidales bacterium]|nr:RagB/SusD family nutrient uptake outer membrane protein [Bacteroidales bacterium]
MKRIIYSILTLGLLIGFTTSCTEDRLDPTLAQQKNVATLDNQEDLKGLVHGIYNNLQDVNYYGRDYVIYGETMSDNCFANNSSGRFLEPSGMTIGVDDGYPANTWSDMYTTVARANLVLQQDPADIEGDEATINDYMGQAYALRALAHFDLLKMFGQQHVDGSDLGIPYFTSYTGFVTEFEEEDFHPTRQSISEVRTQLYNDIDQAISRLSANTSSPFYFNKFSAQALKSRIALYFGDMGEVITAAEGVISSENYEVLPADAYVDYWQNGQGANSLLELKHTGTDNPNINGLAYIYKSDSYGDVEVNPDMAAIFDSSDVRMMGQLELNGTMVNMIGYSAWEKSAGEIHNNGKFPDVQNFSDNYPIIRYEEVILNYAEALWSSGESAGLEGKTPLEYLNMIPNHRGANTYSAINEDNILMERRKELAFEGHRFHDLLRVGRDIPNNGPASEEVHGQVPYGDFRLAFPIPEQEMNANKNITQNQGY